MIEYIYICSCELYWHNAANDLEAYAAHAGRVYVDASDAQLLMRRLVY